MKATAPYAIIGLGVLVMGLIAWWFGFRNTEPTIPEAPAAPDITVTEGLSIYTNGEHGFLLTYPSGAEVAEAFANPWLPEQWSYTADQSSGSALVQITTYRVESETTYPRHFTALVRVGMSTDPGEVARCESVREGSGETSLPDEVLGDVTFKAFSFGDAATMRYVKGMSYRTVHEGACYALESIAAGSSYRDEQNVTDIPQETLDNEYARLDEIVDSFRFAR